MTIRQSMQRCGGVVFVMSLCVAAPPAAAQVSADRGWIAARAGVNVERSEDDLRGDVPGGGVAVAFALQRAWSPEIEFWYPGWIRTDATDGRHRDILAAVAVRRRFGSGWLRPYLLVGGSIARTETQFRTCTGLVRPPGAGEDVVAVISCADAAVIASALEKNSSVSLFALGGAGAEIALTRKLRLLPDVRVDFAVTAVIMRPSLGIAVVF
jgi:hypothetical protein